MWPRPWGVESGALYSCVDSVEAAKMRVPVSFDCSVCPLRNRWSKVAGTLQANETATGNQNGIGTTPAGSDGVQVNLDINRARGIFLRALGDTPALRDAAQEHIGDCATGIVSVS